MKGIVMDYSALLQNIQELADARGLSISKLATEIGIHPATLLHYVNGQREPSLTCVIKLAQYFGVTVDWLLGIGSEEGKPDKARIIGDKYKRASVKDKQVVDFVLNLYTPSFNEN